MARLKNIRHETFARNYVVTGNLGQAYRETRIALCDPPLTHPDSARIIGHKISRKPKVARRIEELRTAMAKKSDITMDKVLTDLQEAINMARFQAKPNDLVNASMAQAKLVGLLRDRVETGSVGDFDGMESVAEILQKVADEAGSEAALILAKAFGLEKVGEAEELDEGEEAAALMNKAPPSDSVN